MLKKIFILIFIYTNIYPAAAACACSQMARNEISHKAYADKAQEIFDKTLSIEENISQDIHQFLRGKIDDIKKLGTNSLAIAESLQNLNKEQAALQLLENVSIDSGDKKPIALFNYAFVIATHELRTLEIRYLTKCYITELDKSEIAYASQMEKVSQEEYTKRVRKFSTQEINEKLIISAGRLAVAIYVKLEQLEAK